MPTLISEIHWLETVCTHSLTQLILIQPAGSKMNVNFVEHTLCIASPLLTQAEMLTLSRFLQQPYRLCTKLWSLQPCLCMTEAHR